MLTRISHICLLLIPIMALGQLPATNMFHFTIMKVGEEVKLKNPSFITAFNEDGYNNQPYFIENDVLFLTSDYYHKGQTDIVKLDFFEESLKRVTNTSESEYSPALIPGKKDFSVVRVEADGKTQTLSSYPLDGQGRPRRYLGYINNIGYYAWINEENVVLFLVKEPHHEMAVARVTTGQKKTVLDRIGRTFKVDNKNMVHYVHKLYSDQWYLKKFNFEKNQSTEIVEMPTGTEDFEILFDGSYIAGQGSRLLRYIPGIDQTWKEIADLSSYGIINIKRLATRKNRLIVVDQKP